MRWLVTGADGMLGRDVVAGLAREARPGDHTVALDRRALDVTDPDALSITLAELRPTVVINCAAHTAVAAIESDTGQAERAFAVNGDGPRLLAGMCAEHGARLVHVSTDYVFSGEARSPYPEDHPCAPGTVYGRRYELAWEVFRLAGADPGRVRPTSAAAYGHPVPVPRWSALAHDRWHRVGITRPRHWRIALREAMAALAGVPR